MNKEGVKYSHCPHGYLITSLFLRTHTDYRDKLLYHPLLSSSLFLCFEIYLPVSLQCSFRSFLLSVIATLSKDSLLAISSALRLPTKYNNNYFQCFIQYCCNCSSMNEYFFSYQKLGLYWILILVFNKPKNISGRFFTLIFTH